MTELSRRDAAAARETRGTVHFVEPSPERIAALAQLKAEYSSRRMIPVRQGDCKNYFRDQVAANPKLNWKYQ